MVMIVNVFPDYSSSGLWDDDTGEGLDISDFDVNDLEFVSLLKHIEKWNNFWDRHLSHLLSTEVDDYINNVHSDWIAFGKILVDQLNKIQNKHIFIYRTDLL